MRLTPFVEFRSSILEVTAFQELAYDRRTLLVLRSFDRRLGDDRLREILASEGWCLTTKARNDGKSGKRAVKVRATSLVATWTAGATFGNSTSSNVLVSAGDLISVEIKLAAGSGSITRTLKRDEVI